MLGLIPISAGGPLAKRPGVRFRVRRLDVGDVGQDEVSRRTREVEERQRLDLFGSTLSCKRLAFPVLSKVNLA